MKLRQFLVLGIAILVGIPLAAQTVTGTMRGSTIDRSEGASPGVTITIRSVETGLERIVTTDRSEVRWWIPGNDINSPTTFGIVLRFAYRLKQ